MVGPRLDGNANLSKRTLHPAGYRYGWLSGVNSDGIFHFEKKIDCYSLQEGNANLARHSSPVELNQFRSHSSRFSSSKFGFLMGHTLMT